MPQDTVISQGNVSPLRRQSLGQLAFVYDRLFKEEVRCDISAAGKWMASAVRICEITAINEKTTAFTQDVVQQVMIMVLEPEILLWAKREENGGSMRTQALEKMEAFARCVFFPIGFVVGTVPTTHSVNDEGSPTIHSWISIS
jgi:hypothetical protein